MTTAAATAPKLNPHLQQIDEIYELIDHLDHAISSLLRQSWGDAEDGSTAIPCPDGTAADIAKHLFDLAHTSTGICEQRKDLAQPGEY